MKLFATRGMSMVPSILPGARLEAAPVRTCEIRLGDVVCYPGGGNVLIAHRVIDRTKEGQWVIRGDARIEVETLGPNAIAMRVRRVVGPFYSYRMDGPLGQVFKKIALAQGTLWRLYRLGLASSVTRFSIVKKRFFAYRQNTEEIK